MRPVGAGASRPAARVLGVPPPVRGALGADDYSSALRANRGSSRDGIGISKQCFGLFKKLREVDAAMTPALQERIREAHPEIAFLEIGGAPARHPKRCAAGHAERQEFLREAGLGAAGEGIAGFRGPGWGDDDVIDALAFTWSAARILAGTALRLPASPMRDARGLAMEIWA